VDRYESELLARMPPEIVKAEPRYRQKMIGDEWAGTPDIPQWMKPREPSPMPIWHLDGVDWYKAPPPPKRHEHWAQTVGCLKFGDEMWRCPCASMGGPARPGRGGQIIWVHLDEPRVAAAPRRRWWRRAKG
jgi:hypothetical protein